MSRLEVENMATITALARGLRTLEGLHPPERLPLARWAVKTAFALHSAANYRSLVPTAHFRYLATHADSLPDGVHVVGTKISGAKGFSWSQSTSWVLYQNNQQFEPNRVPNLVVDSYKIAIRLEQLMLLVAFQSAFEAWRALLRGVHVPLHPYRGPVVWVGDQKFRAQPIPSKFPMEWIALNYGLATKEDRPRWPR